MRNFIQDGDVLTVAAPAAVSSGDVVVVGGIVGVATTDAESAANVAVATRGVFTLTKKTSLVISAGDAVYWDSDPGETNKTDTDVYLGVAVESELSAATTVKVKLLASA